MSAESPFSSPDAGIPEASSSMSEPIQASTHAPRLGQYYRSDSSRLSFTELWRDTRSPLVLIAWLTKLLRIKVPGSIDDANVVSLRPFMVPDDVVEATLPADARRMFEPVIRELRDLGFDEPVYFMIHDRFHHYQMCQAALLHRDGRTAARVIHRVEGIQTLKTHMFTEFLSVLRSGVFLYSSGAQARMFVPGACELNWKRRASTSQLWVSHAQKLEAAAQSGDPAVVVYGRDQMVDMLERHHEIIRNFHLERGLFSSMQGEDLALAEALEKGVEQGRNGQARYPEIFAHLERLQKKQTNWTSAILVLFVSIGLFIGAGMGAWKLSWKLLLVIVGVLLVHEAGHYLAMKLFHYRNVRMFFIPLLGAAVSGHHFTAPGWKKVVVSLMGPLPGIFLGGVLGIAGIIKGNDAMIKVAVMAVILNGFQLLPVLPLDGGRVMQGVLFSRNPYLNTVFHVVAAVLLASIGSLAGDKLLLYLGVFMLLGVPMAHKVAKIVTELRQQGYGPSASPAPATALPGSTWPPSAAPVDGYPAPTPQQTAVPADGFAMVSPQSMDAPQSMAPIAPPLVPLAGPSPAPTALEEQSIPQPVAEAIIERTQARFRRVKSPRQLAQLTLHVYETLASRPCGVGASLGFVFVHGASFVMALMLLVVFMVAQDPRFKDRIAGGRPDPAYSIDADTITEWHGTSDSPSISTDIAAPATEPSAFMLDQRATIIATFSTADEARRAFDRVKQEAPASSSLVHFGQSVLLSLPWSDESTRTRWFDEFDGSAEDVFVDGGDDSRASLMLTCRPLDIMQVEEMEEYLSRYFNIPAALYLIPPWAGDDLDRRSQKERARHEEARAMYCRLRQTVISEMPELEALSADIRRALRRNNEAEYKRLSRQYSDLYDQLLLRELKRIRDEEADPIERELADRYIAIREDELKAEKAGQAEDEPENEEEWKDYEHKQFARQREELGPLMGQLPLSPDDGRPTPQALRYSHSFGYAMQSGSNRILVYVSFEDVSHGAPTLLKWLRERGYRNFKYEFQAAYSDYDWEE